MTKTGCSHVGAGVIGLCSAYHLLKAGRSVTIIDGPKSTHTSCSFGNAGMVVPSHFISLAAPGMVSKGLKMLANPAGPFYIRPRANLELVRWCKIFMVHCNPKHTSKVKKGGTKMTPPWIEKDGLVFAHCVAGIIQAFAEHPCASGVAVSFLGTCNNHSEVFAHRATHLGVLDQGHQGLLVDVCALTVVAMIENRNTLFDGSIDHLGRIS